jgi:glycine cleavage system H lipoate-binding protein
LPEKLQYHAGHSWLFRERKNVMRVGVDEFAAALLGRVEKIELPKPGHWIRQGQRALGFLRGDQKSEMVSPIEGEVVEINSDVLNDPALMRQDPYGKGWLMTVFVPDEESTTRNLLPKGLVRGWMREAVQRLYAMQPELAGAVAADGGRPAEDLSVAFPNKPWTELTGEFFLTR